jgi:lantibiotic modifying enzyme
MAPQQGLEALARAGADSVYGYLARTAEVVPDGVRWQTLTFTNAPQYAANVSNGVAGVSLFLSDYARLTGLARAQELARQALDWCVVPGRALRTDFPTESDTSLGLGWAGVGLAWLRHAADPTDTVALGRAAELAARVLRAAPGPATALWYGAAGEGLFLLRLWEAVRHDPLLAGAAGRGAWLERVAVRDAAGCRWPRAVGTNPRQPLGMTMGSAGIGIFLLRLHAATGDARWAALARGVADGLRGQARPDGRQRTWPTDLGAAAKGATARPELALQWCTGAPGIGLFYATAYEVLGDAAFLEAATAAGEATWAAGDLRHTPCQCHGLAGGAHLLLELARLTDEAVWWERTADFVHRALAYRTAGPDGESWLTDEPGLCSPDFMWGAAGVGHLFLRVAAPDRFAMPLL